MLFRYGTWIEAGRNLKRIHKDKRARKHTLRFLSFISVPVLVVAYITYMAGTGVILLAPPVLFLIWWNNRRQAKENAVSLSILPDEKPKPRVLTDQERMALRRYFADMAVIYAVIVCRTGSEIFLKTKVLPEGMEVISRRTHLDVLRTRGIWEKLGQGDREALMMADGHWTPEMIQHAQPAIEPLRLLRWILRIDFYMPVVGQQMRVDYKLADNLVRDPENVDAGKDLITVAGVERAGEAAQHFFVRCYAEGVARKYYQATSEEKEKWASNVATTLEGRQHEDLVLAISW
jgi:hypothetical protein